MKEADFARVEERLGYIARRRYRFRDEVASRLARSTVEVFRQRPEQPEQPEQSNEVLIRLLRGKCREHIRRQISKTAQQNAIRDVMPRADVPVALASGALDGLSSRDARQLVLEAIAELRPRAREAFQFLHRGATRIDLLDSIERLGINKTTMDSRLSAYRDEFCRILARCGMRP